MKNIHAIWLLACVPAFGACSSEQPSLSTQSAVPPADSAVTSRAADTQPTRTTVPEEAWTVSETGIGPVRTGMTLQETRDILPGLRTAEGSDDLATAACTYARSPSLPSGAVLMFENGRVVRVDVHTGSSRSVEGAGIGDTEARLKSLYGDRVRTSPHKYTDGHYLTVQAKTDSTHKMIFETDGVKVLRFRSGRSPAVEYVEGCG